MFPCAGKGDGSSSAGWDTQSEITALHEGGDLCHSLLPEDAGELAKRNEVLGRREVHVQFGTVELLGEAADSECVDATEE